MGFVGYFETPPRLHNFEKLIDKLESISKEAVVRGRDGKPTLASRNLEKSG
jgi:hypothetical protein